MEQNSQTPFLKRVNNVEKSVEELKEDMTELKIKIEIILKSLRSK